MAFDTAWRILGHVQDTEDVVQEALLGAFRLQQERGVDNWGGLLRHLATARALDALRKRRATVILEFELPAATRDQPEAIAIGHELAEQLRLAIARLPDREASVFCMRYFGQMSNTEVAEALSISADAVAVALHKARSKLKERLVDQEASARRSSDE
jgi:RNA polymerase sigma-70 factor (ECF subfamily)